MNPLPCGIDHPTGEQGETGCSVFTTGDLDNLAVDHNPTGPIAVCFLFSENGIE